MLLHVIIYYIIYYYIDSNLTFNVALVYKCGMFTSWITPKIICFRYISGNPFECSCDLESFTVFVQTKGLVVNSFGEKPKCNSPAHLKGVQIIDVSFKDMGCGTTYGKYNAKTCLL